MLFRAHAESLPRNTGFDNTTDLSRQPFQIMHVDGKLLILSRGPGESRYRFNKVLTVAQSVEREVIIGHSNCLKVTSSILVGEIFLDPPIYCHDVDPTNSHIVRGVSKP